MVLSLQAIGAAADRLKPQELANACWAWATLRFFPGAQLLDSLLALAGTPGLAKLACAVCCLFADV
jgi:hypothetical protein